MNSRAIAAGGAGRRRLALLLLALWGGRRAHPQRRSAMRRGSPASGTAVLRDRQPAAAAGARSARTRRTRRAGRRRRAGDGPARRSRCAHRQGRSARPRQLAAPRSGRAAAPRAAPPDPALDRARDGARRAAAAPGALDAASAAARDAKSRADAAFELAQKAPAQAPTVAPGRIAGIGGARRRAGAGGQSAGRNGSRSPQARTAPGGSLSWRSRCAARSSAAIRSRRSLLPSSRWCRRRGARAARTVRRDRRAAHRRAGARALAATGADAQCRRQRAARRRLPRSAAAECRAAGAHPPDQRDAGRRRRNHRGARRGEGGAWRSRAARSPSLRALPPAVRAPARRHGSTRRRRASRRSRRRASLPTTRSARSARRRHEGQARMIRVRRLPRRRQDCSRSAWCGSPTGPGRSPITWLGYRADTSVMVADDGDRRRRGRGGHAVVAVRGSLLRSPQAVLARACASASARRAIDAISRGLIAIGAGDARAAQRHAAKPRRASPGEPLALLLRAQTAQLAGDRAGAEDAFRAMAERADTRLLGLRGLYVEAQRRNDPVAARLSAEEAAKDAPALPWAGQAVLEFRCAAGDWDGALAILDRHRRGRHDRPRRIPAPARRAAHRARARRRGRDRDARAHVRARGREARARPRAGRGARRPPARRSAASGARPAAILEARGRRTRIPISPKPTRICGSRIRRATGSRACRRWRGMAPGHVESALAVARAALDAHEFATARAALAPLLAAPTQRVAMLMAELEQLEGDEGRAREWMARALNAARDPAWTADGYRVRPLDAGVAGHRPARCVPMEGAGRGARRARAGHDRGAGRARAARAVRPELRAGASARGSLAAARQRDAGDDRAACRARRPARRADHSARRRSRTTRAPSRRRIPMRSWPSRSPDAWQRIRQLFR